MSQMSHRIDFFCSLMSGEFETTLCISERKPYDEICEDSIENKPQYFTRKSSLDIGFTSWEFSRPDHHSLGILFFHDHKLVIEWSEVRNISGVISISIEYHFSFRLHGALCK